MNMFKEINAFQMYVKEWYKLSTGETSLWYTLLGLNNRFCWEPWFAVQNETLIMQTSLSKQALINARKTLVEKGIIEYKKGGHKKPGSYRLVPFEEQLAARQSRQCEEQNDMTVPNEDQGNEPIGSTSNSKQLTHHLDININNNKKEKENNKKLINNNKTIHNLLPDDIKEQFEYSFNEQPTNAHVKEILSYLEHGIEVRFICHAFNKAAEKNAPFLYAKRILDSACKKGIKTYDQFAQSNSTNQSPNRRKIIREERLPEWFKQRNTNEQTALSSARNDEHALNEMREILKKYKREDKDDYQCS